MLTIVLLPLLFVDFTSILFFEMPPIFFPFVFYDTKQEKKNWKRSLNLIKLPTLGFI
jgi:hypothetical protein